MKTVVMGVSLLLGVQAWAAAPGEIATLRKAINANKDSIETFLETKAHAVAASRIDALNAITNINLTNGLSEESIMGQIIIDVLNKAILSDANQTNYFKGVDAITNALYYYTGAEPKEPLIENAPAVYALTVLNPEHVEFLNTAQLNYKESAETTTGDPLLSLMSNYYDNSISAKKFATYEEAAELTKKINDLQTDLRQLDSLVLKSAKAQERLDSFKTKIDLWLNKKIVFLRLNPNGLNAEVIQDRELIVANDTKNGIKLNRNYSTSSIASKIRKYYRDLTLERNDGPITITARDDKGKNKKLSFKYQDRIDVFVTIDRSSALVQIPSGSFRVGLTYVNANKLAINIHDEQVYNGHNNTDPATAIKSIFDAKDVMLKSVHKDLANDWFLKDLGINSFSIN